MIETTPEKWQWDAGHQEVRFCAWQNGVLVMCRISREAIEDRCPDPPTPGACVEANIFSNYVIPRCLRRGR